jgi:hypothetical protein
MSTTTPNLSLTLPTPNVDSGWGSTLNTDFTLIDNLFPADGSGTSVGVQVGAGKTLNAGGTIIAGGTLILGSGDNTNTVTPPTIRGAARTGTNAAGGNLTIDAINGTGTGGSGKIIFRTAPASGTPGTTANTMASVLEVNSAGAIGIAGANYGSANQVLLSGGSAATPSWSNVNGTVITIPSQAQGDILYRGELAWERLPAGTSGQLLQTKGSAQNPQWVSASPAPNVIINDQKSAGVSGGTFTSGANRTRDLNTLVRNSGSLASLASNRFTLPAGTYYIKWSAPAYFVNNHQSFLYNVTSAAIVERGTSAYTTAGDNPDRPVTTTSTGEAVVTIASSTPFEIQHRCNYTKTTNGFGDACGFGTEIYTTVSIWLVPT